MSWTMGDGLVYTWRPGEEAPHYFLQHVADGGMVGVHNATFERNIWRMMRQRGYDNWPELRIAQQDCTQSRAAAHGLPQDLDTLGRVLSATETKDDAGHRLMLKLSSPRKINTDGSITWWDDPTDIEYLCYTYCPQDVRTEGAIDCLLPPLSPHERKIWELDQLINDRGIHIDEEAVTRAIDVVLLAKQRADIRMHKLTDGHVKKCTQIDKLVEWINLQGVTIDNAKKGNHDYIVEMANFIDAPQVRDAILLRKEAAKTSTSKYSKMLQCVCDDGNIRGLLNYHGAGPGRWAGRLVQPQNFPRVDPDNDGPMVEYVAEVLSTAYSIPDALDMIEMAGFDPLPALSKALRGMICAA